MANKGNSDLTWPGLNWVSGKSLRSMLVESTAMESQSFLRNTRVMVGIRGVRLRKLNFNSHMSNLSLEALAPSFSSQLISFPSELLILRRKSTTNSQHILGNKYIGNFKLSVLDLLTSDLALLESCELFRVCVATEKEAEDEHY